MKSPTGSTPWIPIIGYHRVVAARPPADPCQLCATGDRLSRQMQWFARLGYQTLSLEEAAACVLRGEPLPRYRFVIVFADGYEDTFTVAAPVLREFGFTATVFVVTGLVGKRSAWDAEQGSDAPLMTWAQLERLAGMGFSIGSHTVSHPHLSHLSADVARREIVESREMLERRLHRPVRTFCYPYGDWSDSVRALVREAGYEVACDGMGRRVHERYALAQMNPRFWLAPLTPLVRCRRWYFELNRSGALELPRRGMRAVRRAATRSSARARAANNRTGALGGTLTAELAAAHHQEEH